MQQQRLVWLCAATLALLAASVAANNPGWVANPATVRENFLDETQFTTKRVIFFTIGDVKFRTEMGSDRSVFPGSCVSDSTNNIFGWNKFKNQLISATEPVRLSYRRRKTTVTFTVSPTPGFTIGEEETIRCGQGFTEEDGTAYLRSSTPLSDDQENFQFTIRASTRVVVQFLNEEKEVASTGLNGPTDPKDTGLDEDHIRDNGLRLSLVCAGDAWRAPLLEDILRTISCKSNDAAACAWFYLQLNTSSMIVYDGDTGANNITLYVPRETTRLMNFDEDLTIRVDPIVNDTFTFGYKSPTTAEWQMELSDVEFKINVFMNEPIFEFPADKNTITTTERCIRKRDYNDGTTCTNGYFFTLKSIRPRDGDTSGFIQFSIGLKGIQDMKEIAFKSRELGDLDPFGFMDYGKSPSGGDATDQLNITAKPAWDYEIRTADEITIDLPYSLFTNKEPPKQQIKIQVLPSAGELYGYMIDPEGRLGPYANETFMDLGVNATMEQRLFWKGNFTIVLALGGDTWPTNFNDTDVFLKTTGIENGYATGTETVPDVGWKQFKKCILPPGSIQFGVSSRTGAANYSELRFDINRCPEYLMPQDERITFDFPSDQFSMPLAYKQDLEFLVKQSPGEYQVLAEDFYEEGTVQDGLASFLIQLSGEVWDSDNATCFRDMEDFGWTSDVNQSARDPNGWSNAATREAMLRVPNTRDYVAFSKVDKFTVRVTFRANTVYDTRKGENITVGVPVTCLVGCNNKAAGCPNKKPISASNDPRIKVLPKNGNVSLTVAASSDPVDLVSESLVRNGGFSFYLRAIGDNFEDILEDQIRPMVPDAFTSSSQEPFGFAKKLRFLMNVSAIRVNLTHIEIPMVRYVKYDIKGNETIQLDVSPFWMASGRLPMNGSYNVGQCPDDSCPINFEIYASAGDIQVDWYGQPSETLPQIRVTEDDVRAGNIWFNFKLLGDQWRNERSPFKDMFTSTSNLNTGFQALTRQLVPSIEFFTFNTTEIYEECRVPLQSTDVYDIPFAELVFIELVSKTMTSGIPPVFIQNRGGQNLLVEKFEFLVEPTSGQAILSGVSGGLNEKMIRRGGVKIFITLFGETWGQSDSELAYGQTEERMLENIRSMRPTSAPTGPGIGDENNGGTAFNDRKEYILPPGSARVTRGTGQLADQREIVVTLAKDEKYDIGSMETLNITLPGILVRSNLPPTFATQTIPIEATGGELVLEPIVITENDIRAKNINIELKVLGAAWEVNPITEPAFLQGFSSLSSTIKEPHGFFANRGTILGPGASYYSQVTGNAVVRLSRTPRYDIDDDEVITFTMRGTRYIEGSTPLDPASIEFRILTVPRKIFIIFSRPAVDSQNFEVAGAVNVDFLREQVGELLSVDVERVGVFDNGTNPELVKENLQAVYLTFKTTPSTVTTDRSNAELGDMLMSIRTSFLGAPGALLQGARYVFFEENPPDLSTLKASLDTPAPAVVVDETSSLEIVIWSCGAVGFVLLVVGGFALLQYFQQGDLTGTSRRGNNPDGLERYGAGGEFTDIPNDVGKNNAGEFKRRNKRKANLHAVASAVTRAPPPKNADGVEHKPTGLRDLEIGSRATIKQNEPTTMKDYVRRQMGTNMMASDAADFVDDEAGGIGLNPERRRMQLQELRKEQEADDGKNSSSGNSNDSEEPTATATREERLQDILESAQQRRSAGQSSRNTSRHVATMMDMS